MTKKKKIIYIISSILFVIIITVSTILIFKLISTSNPKNIADSAVSAAEKAAKAGDYSKAIKLYDEAIDQYHKLGDVKAEKAARIDQYGAKAMLNQNNSIKDIIVDTGN